MLVEVLGPLLIDVTVSVTSGQQGVGRDSVRTTKFTPLEVVHLNHSVFSVKIMRDLRYGQLRRRDGERQCPLLSDQLAARADLRDPRLPRESLARHSVLLERQDCPPRNFAEPALR